MAIKQAINYFIFKHLLKLVLVSLFANGVVHADNSDHDTVARYFANEDEAVFN